MHQNSSSERIESMGSTYQELFRALPEESLPTHLCERVLWHVSRKRVLHRRIRLAGASLSIAASVAGFLFAIPALILAATQSGFSILASLALSDSGVIAGHFSTFLVSLAETIPSFEFLLVLALSAAFLASLRSLLHSLPVRTFGTGAFSH